MKTETAKTKNFIFLDCAAYLMSAPIVIHDTVSFDIKIFVFLLCQPKITLKQMPTVVKNRKYKTMPDETLRR